ncbi:MAG: phosphohistidine phosphatase SixA [Verrucomicrobiota bacterium]|jgi:phosphohistidine phosphatase
MRLFLLRHADADTLAATDAQRPLSDLGRRQAESVAQALKNHASRPKLILTSPTVRTMQTAETVASHLSAQVIPCEWARPGMPPEEALLEIAPYAGFKEVMLVGHQPDLALLAARLIGLPQPTRIQVRKATLLLFTFTSPANAILEALIPCNTH